MSAKSLAEIVNDIFNDSLFKPEELHNGMPPADAVIVDAIIAKFGFHRQRLESHRQEVVAALQRMNPKFHTGTGDGYTFLNLCETADGEQWGEHQNCEQLVGLAFGLELGRFTMPRAFWGSLPGGMPYVTFDITKETVS